VWRHPGHCVQWRTNKESRTKEGQLVNWGYTCGAENSNLFYIEPINRGIGRISIFIAQRKAPASSIVSPVPCLRGSRMATRPWLSLNVYGRLCKREHVWCACRLCMCMRHGWFVNNINKMFLPWGNLFCSFVFSITFHWNKENEMFLFLKTSESSVEFILLNWVSY